jgi:hypothetical protein
MITREDAMWIINNSGIGEGNKQLDQNIPSAVELYHMNKGLYLLSTFLNINIKSHITDIYNYITLEMNCTSVIVFELKDHKAFPFKDFHKQGKYNVDAIEAALLHVKERVQHG